MKNKVFRLLIVMLLILVPVSITAYADIDVNLENVVNDYTVPVQFDSVEPMTINDSTVVPLRKFCESAGFEVHWTDASKTAHIILNANKSSELPIERYAYEMMTVADTKGLELYPKNITVSLKVDSDTITLRYNYTDAEGDIISLGSLETVSVPVIIVGSGSIVVPLRSLMETFGMWVDWNANAITISIPPFVSARDNLEFVSQDNSVYDDSETDNLYASVGNQSNVPEGAVYLGNFRISHYCACSKCSGPYGNATAWAGPLNIGVTIAVDPKVIPKLSDVYIDGYGLRRAEDCGGAIKGNRIDVAVASHSEALQLGVVYKDVWILP